MRLACDVLDITPDSTSRRLGAALLVMLFIVILSTEKQTDPVEAKYMPTINKIIKTMIYVNYFDVMSFLWRCFELRQRLSVAKKCR